MSLMSFDQVRLDSSLTVGEEELQKTKHRLQELEAEVITFKENELEFIRKQTLMQNSLQSFARDLRQAKEQLGLAELRNQELKEQNVKTNAQLSGRIDLLLNERQAYNNLYEEEFWCEVPQFALIASYKKVGYTKLRVRVDLENHTIMTAQPYEPISASNA